MRAVPPSFAAVAMFALGAPLWAQADLPQPRSAGREGDPPTASAGQQGGVPPSITIVMQPRAASPASPDDTPFNPPDIPHFLLERVRPNMTLEEFVADAAGALRRADLAADGLDADDVELAAAVPLAEARARLMPLVLKFDLDGDFSVTRGEVERATRGDRGERTEAAGRLLDRFDADRDGTITLSEIAAAANPVANRHDEGLLEALVAADPSGDGRLTIDELQAMAKPVFAGVDRDGDGLVSTDEYTAASPRIRAANAIAQKAPCPVPLPPGDAKVLVLSAYEGAMVSSAFVGSADMETNAVDVSIEPGTEPLYLVMTSYEANIWRIGGQTGRVAHAVVNSLTAFPPQEKAGEATVSAAGITGLPADKVTVVAPDCWRYFSRSNEGEATMALSLIAASVGRKVDAVLANYAMGQVSLPSGEMAEPRESEPAMPAGFDPPTWEEAVRFWPGGLAQIDPASVVAAAPVGAYAVLPSQMGLAQLVGAGALERIDGRTFRVIEPIAHLPPRMTGAHSANLLLAEGVPLPPGDPGHACIRPEGDGPEAGVCAAPPPAPIIRSVR